MLRQIEFGKANLATALLMIVLVMLVASGTPLEAQNASVISGVVKNASGATVEGALIRVRSTELSLSFMVVSQAQGRYSTPNLLPGKYVVEGIGGDYQSSPGEPVEVGRAGQAKMDLVLSVARKATPPRKWKTAADYEAAMPEGPAKHLVTTKCALCHDLNGVDIRALRIEASRQEWEEVMGVHMYYMEDLPEALSYKEKDMIVEYMTKHFSEEGTPHREPRGAAPDPNSHLPRTLLTGTEARFVVMEFSLPRGAAPHDISVDSQGIAWTSEHGERGVISSFDPKALSYKEFIAPRGKFPTRPSGTAVDPQGTVWSVDNGKNARMIAYNPRTGQFKTYDLPAPPRQQEFDSSGDGAANINTITFQDGFVWGSGLLAGQIYRLDPASGGVITYPAPKGRPPYGLAFDKDKMIWYGVEFGDEIVKLDPATGKRTHYKVLTPQADLRHIQTDAEGNLWASAQQTSKLIKVDGRTGHVSEYAPPTPLSGINSVDVDRKKNLIWVAEAEADKLARYDPRTNTFAEFPLPTLGAALKRIAVDPSNPNRVWWCANGSDRIGYVEVLE